MTRFSPNIMLIIIFLIDLYGADDNEYAVPVVEAETQASSTEEVKISIKEEPTTSLVPHSPRTNQVPSSSEGKLTPTTSIPTTSPTSHTISPTSYNAQIVTAPPVSNGTPYSTQVSQQFSTYQHATSMGSDRQDYAERAEIPQVDTTGERSHINVVDRSVRPSEMKDEG